MFSLKMVKGTELAEGVQAEMTVPSEFSRFSIGRDPGNHWPIPDATRAISARHCELVGLPSGAVVLRDLSTNGTFVNSGAARIVGDHPLHDGDRIELGPYAIVVQGLAPRAAAVPAQPTAFAHAPAAPARPISVEATAPLRGAAMRGGDPAAMLAGGGTERVGLTEILRSAPPAEDSALEVTKIRVAPKPAAAATAAARPGAAATPAAPAAASAPAPAAPATPPVAQAPPLAARHPEPASNATPVDPMLAALASGLGLPGDALAARNPAQTAAQVSALARAAVCALRQLLEQQAQARRQIGSRASALGAVREINPLRMAPTPEAALQALLAPGADAQAALQHTATELAAHQDRLLAAFRGAATRLGQDIAPSSLQSALGGGGDGSSTLQQAQLWALYTQVWQGLGMAPGQPWSQGFLEAALMHLAAAYDDPGKT